MSKIVTILLIVGIVLLAIAAWQLAVFDAALAEAQGRVTALELTYQTCNTDLVAAQNTVELQADRIVELQKQATQAPTLDDLHLQEQYYRGMFDTCLFFLPDPARCMAGTAGRYVKDWYGQPSPGFQWPIITTQEGQAY